MVTHKNTDATPGELFFMPKEKGETVAVVDGEVRGARREVAVHSFKAEIGSIVGDATRLRYSTEASERAVTRLRAGLDRQLADLSAAIYDPEARADLGGTLVVSAIRQQLQPFTWRRAVDPYQFAEDAHYRSFAIPLGDLVLARALAESPDRPGTFVPVLDLEVSTLPGVILEMPLEGSTVQIHRLMPVVSSLQP
jgi:hypothetical protein